LNIYATAGPNVGSHCCQVASQFPSPASRKFVILYSSVVQYLNAPNV